MASSARWGATLASCDVLAWFVAMFVSAILRFEFSLADLQWGALAVAAISVAGLGLVVGHFMGLYRNRYLVGSFDEALALGWNVVIVSASFGITVFLLSNPWGFPRSIMFLAAPIFLLLGGGFRVLLRTQRLRARGPSVSGPRSVVYGAGSAAESLIPQLLDSVDSPFTPVALLDDDPSKSNRWIRGVPTAGSWGNLSEVVASHSATVLIVAIPSASSELFRKIYAESRDLGLRVIVLPSLSDYLAGKASVAELKEVGIEDLIGRSPVTLDTNAIAELLRNKKVLVTGAGGSIGSELAKQISTFSPASLIILDRDETGLLSTLMGIGSSHDARNVETALCDIRDEEAVLNMLERFQPEVVFHAAALKHLSILQEFPQEAWKTNVVGTWNVLQAAARCEVPVFVNISTDKAANPSSVLGKTKRLGEELTAWVGKETGQKYVSVRFGNVLGSRGSLIPILAEQIASGGPVTVTDKRATRYFMAISEACQLVLQAASHGYPQEVMILDMGLPFSINEIAVRMIELSGRDVQIIYTGLKTGEKIHEELYGESEEPLPSQHPSIMKLKAEPRAPEVVLGGDLLSLFNSQLE